MEFVELSGLFGFLATNWQILTVAVLTFGAVALFVTELIEIELARCAGDGSAAGFGHH